MRDRLWDAAVGMALLALSACSDRMLTAPGDMQAPGALPPGAAVLQCIADVAAEEIRCEPAPPPIPSGVRVDLHVGGQDRYVRLTSSGTHFDAGPREFRSTVTVQNLTRHTMGTDGSSSPGLRVFFHTGPTVVSGSGSVLLQNADGTGTFTASGQPYFLYSTVLEPLQISSGKQWVFHLEENVISFAFSVYVATPLVEETAPLLGPVWTGDGSTDWLAAANWEGGRLPGTDSAVTVPPDSLLGISAFHPGLAAEDSVQHLRVGYGSTLSLEGYRLVVGGNLDVTGAITGGTVRLTGSNALLGGMVPAVEVLGSARLQRPTTASGSVAVSGSLTTGDQPLTISIP